MLVLFFLKYILNIKKGIYKKIENIRKQDSIISSNTSTIPLKVLSADMSDEMKKNFCITHFFNPVRYTGLLEIVTERSNDKDKINFLKYFNKSLYAVISVNPP